jgi:hypothetical protein
MPAQTDFPAPAIGTDKAPSLVVTRQDIATRLGLHGRDSYIVLYNVMKSVSAALIVLAIADIVRRGQPDFPRIPLLVASFLAVVQTYLATTIGSHLLPGRIAIPDVALPLMLILAEAWPIALLSVSVVHHDVIQIWGISMSLFAACSALLVGWVLLGFEKRVDASGAVLAVGDCKRRSSHDRKAMSY